MRTDVCTNCSSEDRHDGHGSPILALRELQVQQAGQSLVISGSVDSFYHKQLAQEAIRAVCRDVELVNSVAVDR